MIIISLVGSHVLKRKHVHSLPQSDPEAVQFQTYIHNLLL